MSKSYNHTVSKGSYTKYINDGHQTLIDSVNQLLKDVLVIGTDVRIVIKSAAIQHFNLSKDGYAELTISRESNPMFVKDFFAGLQTLKFEVDNGRPGVLLPSFSSYEAGYLTVYLTKNFLDGNATQFNSFNTVMNGLVQAQYTNISRDGRDSADYSLCHSGSVLSIDAPVCNMEVWFGDNLFARYCNVKFYSPKYNDGNIITNAVPTIRYNFFYSYISFDSGYVSR